MKVKITRGRTGTWYAGCAGVEFDVIATSTDYIVKMDANSPLIKHINKSDCTIVSSDQKPTKTLL